MDALLVEDNWQKSVIFFRVESVLRHGYRGTRSEVFAKPGR
jgi:hypothetical protein